MHRIALNNVNLILHFIMCLHFLGKMKILPLLHINIIAAYGGDGLFNIILTTSVANRADLILFTFSRQISNEFNACPPADSALPTKWEYSTEQSE